MSQQALSASLLDRLPNEVILNIIAKMPDLTTLYDFLTANPCSANLYRSTYKKILAGTLHQVDSQQLRKLIATIICIRNRKRLVDTDLPSYFTDHLEDRRTPLIIEDISEPLSALQDIVLVAQGIQNLEVSFIASRLRQPRHNARIDQKEHAPSQTELHRIRRAFWRLQLLSDLLQSDSKNPIHADDEDIGEDFISSLTIWEMEELECAFYHWRSQQYTNFNSHIRHSPELKDFPPSAEPQNHKPLLFGMNYGNEGSDCTELENKSDLIRGIFFVGRDNPWMDGVPVTE